MEVRNSLNDFLHHRAVCGFEIKGIPYSAFWGIEKGHVLGKKIMEYYENNPYKEQPNTAIFSNLLVEEFGADADKDEFQELKDGIALYPSHYISLDIHKHYVVPHFLDSCIFRYMSDRHSFKQT